ncbi:MAG TPA: hypothetical protein VFQ61_22310 [Polyangiaceae bacterium]|nr:hypothetical protein [Polyangiaceae bacterium]
MRSSSAPAGHRFPGGMSLTDYRSRIRFVRWLLPASLWVVVADAKPEEASFRVRTHNHEFHRVKVEARECELAYRLYFTAPELEPSKAGKPREFRFQARLRFQDGKSFLSPVFKGLAAGERMYENVYDTSSEGCWAKSLSKVAGVDVEACRGRGCTPAEPH